MKKSFLTFLALAALVASVSLAVAQHEGHEKMDEKMPAAHGKMETGARTIRGEVVDITCYLRRGSRGEEHIKCAEYCANLGMPLGVLEDGTDKLYLIIPAGHADPKTLVFPHLGKKVNIDGVLYAMGGLTGVEIGKIEEVEP